MRKLPKMTLEIGGKKVKGLSAVKIKPGQTSLTLKLPAKVVKQIKRALKKSKKTRVVLALTPATDAAKGAARAVRIR